jgi:acid phosphatase family membrane protein YuiD
MEQGFVALLAFVMGWLFAQALKVVFEWVRTGDLKKGLKYSLKSGGMPSGHTASFVAMTTYFLLSGGVNEIFALSFATMGIIVYDAVNVRKSVGEISEHINDRVGKGEISGGKLRVVRGHTILEVIFGAILGISIGAIVYFLTSNSACGCG